MTKNGRVSRHGADWVKSLSERESGALEEFQERGLKWQDSREWGQEHAERAVSHGWSAAGPQSHKDFVFLILRGMGNTKGFLTGMGLSEHSHICILRQSILLHFGK